MGKRTFSVNDPTPERILVVDDIREYEGAVHAKTCAAAIQLLSSQEWDEIWLDHDLGYDGDIRPVVKWLEERPVLPGDPIIWVITSNPVGMKYIIDALRSKYHLYKKPGGTGMSLKMIANV